MLCCVTISNSFDSFPARSVRFRSFSIRRSYRLWPYRRHDTNVQMYPIVLYNLKRNDTNLLFEQHNWIQFKMKFIITVALDGCNLMTSNPRSILASSLHVVRIALWMCVPWPYCSMTAAHRNKRNHTAHRCQPIHASQPFSAAKNEWKVHAMLISTTHH